jgi:hypothetical protein
MAAEEEVDDDQGVNLKYGDTVTFYDVEVCPFDLIVIYRSHVYN